MRIPGSLLTTLITQSSGRQHTQPVAGLRFNLLAAAISVWAVFGVYLDGWAHYHIPDLDSFYTWWHAVLYSGVSIGGIILTIIGLRNYGRGLPLAQTLPRGYGLTYVGIGLFACGGVGDMLWHTLFGIEIGIEALLSPTHLMLAVGGVLAVSGPLQAAKKSRLDALPTLAQIPIVISVSCTLSIVSYITAFAHPLVYPWAGLDHRPDAIWFGQALGIAAIVLQSAILMTILLPVVARWRLMPGSFTMILTLNAIALSVIQYTFALISVAVLAGLLCDLLYGQLKPFTGEAVAFQIFAFAVPTLFYSVYFLVLLLTEGLWWSPHLFCGASFMAGLVGWLISRLMIAPLTVHHRGS
ncbi:MAG: hypothetical protein KDJ52_06210 [Anaerolineae bacterium]|nr:hypothetical protein [Anaerolineae bacterium]